jgi:hypothetical protein
MLRGNRQQLPVWSADTSLSTSSCCHLFPLHVDA